MIIDFGAHATDEATFWSSWVSAGICSAKNVFTTEYADRVEVTTSWTGIVESSPGVNVSGWHCNVRASGLVAVQFTYGLTQTDGNGNLLSIWDRTWAVEVFNLTYQDADPETGLPAGYRNVFGVTYIDLADLATPANIWA